MMDVKSSQVDSDYWM